MTEMTEIKIKNMPNTSVEHTKFHYKLRKKKNICVIGIGYIGSVAIPCLSKLGHNVIGVDIKKSKIDKINEGKSPINENGLDKLMAQQFQKKRIGVTKDLRKAIHNSEICFICVDTPSNKEGGVELKYLIKVSKDIGKIINECEQKKYLVIRSTIFPGTLEKIKNIIEKYSNKKEGEDFYLLHHPEFMREGTSIKDFFNPPYIVVGTNNLKAGNYILSCYNKLKCKKMVVKPNISQIIKYVNNAFHALKVDWANEIGSICNKLNINGQEVMSLFCEDTQLNLSSYYFSPGFVWGLHCLPKDTKALMKASKNLKLKTPLLNSIIPANDEHFKRCIKLIEQQKKRKIGFLGLSMKEGVEDKRNNSILEMIDYFKKKKYDVVVYDKFLKNTSLKKVLNQDLIVISSREKELDNIARKSGKMVVNLQRW